MSTAIDEACRELRALLGEGDWCAELEVRCDGRVTVRVVDNNRHMRSGGRADLNPGSAHPLPSVALARMVRP